MNALTDRIHLEGATDRMLATLAPGCGDCRFALRPLVVALFERQMPIDVSPVVVADFHGKHLAEAEASRLGGSL